MTRWSVRGVALTAVIAMAIIAFALAGSGSNGVLKKGACEPNSAGNSRILQSLNQAIAKDQNNGPAYFSRGRCLYYLQNYGQAFQDLNEAIRFNPKDAEAFLFRAKTTRMLGRIQQALADYSHSIEIKPSADAYFGRGATLQEEFNDQTDEAFADFNAALRLDRNHIGAYRYRAIFYIDRAKYQKAEADVRAWLALVPNTPEPYCHMGLLRFYEGKDADGRQWFKTCFEKDSSPQNRQYYDNLVQNVYAMRQAQAGRRSGYAASSDDSESARQKRALDVLERSGNDAGARACRNDSSAC